MGVDVSVEGLRTLILVCGKLNSLGNGLDLADLRQWFQDMGTAAQMEVVDDLCHQPRELSRAAASGGERLILGLCSGDYSELEVQSHARKAGIDPLGVEIVNLGSYCARVHARPEGTAKAKVLLSAAVARAQAFPGTGPETVKPYLVRGHQKVSRRALFTLPPIGYRAVAYIQPELCASETGCQLCVETCPLSALKQDGGRVSLDKSRCQACSLCEVACPRGAIEQPTHSLHQLEAQITALLHTPALDSSQPRALLFVCQRNTTMEELGKKRFSYPVSWLPITVPCAGMPSAAWLLQCLALGAEAVSVVGCGGDCSFGQQGHIEGRVAYCRELLGLMGGSPERVRLLDSSSAKSLAQALSEPLEDGIRRGDALLQQASLLGPQTTAQVIQKMSEEYGASPTLSLAHPYSPLGLVNIDADKCTGCGACAEACPTGALAFQQEEGTVSLTFDPSLCSGCGQCVGWCPEAAQQVVHVEKVTNLQALSLGKAVLYQDQEVRCELCGSAIGPSAMIRRIKSVLLGKGDTSAAVMAAITRRCPSCRGAGLGGPIT